VVVPRFVIQELQQLADSADAMKRQKGRRGLEMIAKLQRQPRLDVTIDETVVAGKAVDQMLVELARSMSAMVVTTDLGLARVAAIHAVPVLNMHDLANAVKSALVPGEPVTIKLVRQGEQATQGVGYLGDGTMVVVEDGAASIGQTVTATVTSSLQTSAGRLIFSRIGDERVVAGGPVEQVAEAAEPAAATSGNGAVSGAMAEGGAEAHGGEGEVANGAGQPATRSPFPIKPPRSMKTGTPRNPRR